MKRWDCAYAQNSSEGLMILEDKMKALLEQNSYSVDDLVEIVKILRSENGCPWDKVQTHKSIKKDFLEETYEVMEAIDCNSPDMMREELGDVLLQVAFHTVIENEQEHFNLEDVTTELCEKLIVRHPHVFGSVDADNVDTVLKNWDAIKKETKGQESYTDTLESVPKNFPALMRAQKLGKRSFRARVDFEADSDGERKAWDFVNDEVNNLHETIDCGSEEDKKKALGELLFACCDMARAMGFDAEEVLCDASNDFIKRFKKAEDSAKLQNRELSSISFEEFDFLWRE